MERFIETLCFRKKI